MNKILLFLSHFLLISFSTAGLCQNTLPQNPEIESYQLANGLNVFLLPREKPGLELRLIVHSGSLQETDSQLGLAHFVEHMAFKGTKNFPDKSSFESLEKYGINLGSHINAATSFNTTVYRLSLPGSEIKQLQLGLMVLSDWAFRISFDNDAYESERDIIIEEWRLRQGVAYRINSELDQLRYHGSLYSERAPIGSLDIIRHAPIDEVKAYYSQWYQPQRMSLVVVGQFNAQQLKKEIESLFGSQNKGKSPTDLPQLRDFKSQDIPLIKTIFDAEQGQRIIQFALQRNLPFPINTKQGIEDDISDLVWLTLLNQRLSLLTDNQKLPTAKVNEQGTLFDESRLQYLIFAQPRNADYIDVMQNLFTELQRMSVTPVSDAELEQVKQQILSKLKQQTENEVNYQNSYLADRLVTSIENKLPIQNKAQQSQITSELLDKLTVEKLQFIVGQRLDSSVLRIAIIGPDSDAETINAKQITQIWNATRQTKPGIFPYQKQELNLDIEQPKSGSVIKQTEIPEIKGYEWLLSNGIRVIVHPTPKLTDNVEILLKIPGGLSLEPDDQLGKMRWVQRLSESSGYGEYNSAQLLQFSKQKQVQVKPYAELLFHGLQGNSPNNRLDELFKLFYLKLTAPHFDSIKLEQTQKQFALSYSKQPVERQFIDFINQKWSLHDQLSIELIDYIVNLRLRHYVREQASGVYAIIFSQQLIKQPSPYYLARLNFTTAPNRVNELISLADKIIQDTALNGVMQSELEQAKKAWILDYQEKQLSTSYWVNALAQTATDDNRFDELIIQKEIVEKMTLPEINLLIKATMGKNLKEFILLPKQP